MNDDIAMLREFTERNSEEAFVALGSRHVSFPRTHFQVIQYRLLGLRLSVIGAPVFHGNTLFLPIH